MHGIDLYWLPEAQRWSERMAELALREPDLEQWAELVAMAKCRVSALQTIQLDRRRARTFPTAPAGLPLKPIRLAVLASSTIDHLLPAIRVGGLRRSMFVETYTPAYGQHVQELLNPASELHKFRPDTVLFALDAHHLMQGVLPAMTADGVTQRLEQAVDHLATQWEMARKAGCGQVIQNIPLPVFLPLLGNNEHRLHNSKLTALREFSTLLRARAAVASVDLIGLDDRATFHGLYSWHDPALWHRAKQEIHPLAAPLYGDLVARVLAAAQGQSGKCLVLDLDNTLWGGVIGDDGLAGIKLGQGSARGEAHLAFQQYARDLGSRGIILAVCSKNDEANALEPFMSHPEMILKREDIACFIANWNDKASNLRQIAERLNIGIDSLVFADDNPAERAIIRRELPMVAVPELPEDPTSYAATLADAGYFEALSITTEDGRRSQLYSENAKRESALTSSTDMNGYLESLQMRAIWKHFDEMNLPRIVQLINKTNQFNLTTRRVNDGEIRAVMNDTDALSLQIRLLDQFGDNGIVAMVIGKSEQDGSTMRITTWLMSCRVLGRGMEVETLNLVAAEAERMGYKSLIGEYRPTPKNGMVRDHYANLGFAARGEKPDGTTEWCLDLDDFVRQPTFIHSRYATAEFAVAADAQL